LRNLAGRASTRALGNANARWVFESTPPETSVAWPIAHNRADVARAVAMSLFVAYIVLVIKGDLVARSGQKSAKTRC
jgi:hypothetical protein